MYLAEIVSFTSLKNCWKIRKDFEIEAYIGIGLGYEYLADIRESYTEAKSALQLISMEKQKYVLSYNDMGIHSLISQIRSPRTLDNYINDKFRQINRGRQGSG